MGDRVAGTPGEEGPVLQPVVPTDGTLRALLAQAHTVAVVGLSSKQGRPALDIATFLQGRGYRIVPVHPRETEVLGEPAYPSLRDIPGDVRIDIVDVFRRAEETPEVARDAVAIGSTALWLQQDIVNEEAGRIAEDGGLTVIMGICIKQAIMRLDAEFHRPDREPSQGQRGEPS